MYYINFFIIPIIGLQEIIILSSVFLVILVSSIIVIKTNKPVEETGILGFLYDKDQDIFYSAKDAWQREYGYCYIYDEIAPKMSMIVDSEPVKFSYNNKEWLIEFWKGQYGMTTGAEVGIYYNENKSIMYDSVKDEDMLPISIVLYKKNKLLFKRNDTQWWLTGFVLGEFTRAKNLKMYITISLKSVEMANIFVSSLQDLGYDDTNMRVSNNVVSILYDKPYSKQPESRYTIMSKLRQLRNKFFCMLYQHLTKKFVNTEEKLQYLQENNSMLFNNIIKTKIYKR